MLLHINNKKLRAIIFNMLSKPALLPFQNGSKRLVILVERFTSIFTWCYGCCAILGTVMANTINVFENAFFIVHHRDLLQQKPADIFRTIQQDSALGACTRNENSTTCQGGLPLLTQNSLLEIDHSFNQSDIFTYIDYLSATCDDEYTTYYSWIHSGPW